METAVPTQKVAASAVAGALTTILVYIIDAFVIQDPTQVIPAHVATAITTVISFIVAYLVPPSERDALVDRAAEQ